MKLLLASLIFTISISSYANNKEAYAKMAQQCFSEVSSVLYDELVHIEQETEAGSVEQVVASARVSTLEKLMGFMDNLPKSCGQSPKYRLDCLIEASEMTVNLLKERFDARDLVNDTKACDLL